MQLYITLTAISGGWWCWTVSCWYGDGSLSHYRNAQLWSRMWYASATSRCTCFIIHSMDIAHHQRKLLHDLMNEQFITTRRNRMLNNDDNIHTYTTYIRTYAYNTRNCLGHLWLYLFIHKALLKQKACYSSHKISHSCITHTVTQSHLHKYTLLTFRW